MNELSGTLRDLGEFGLIEALRSRPGGAPSAGDEDATVVEVGSGDDAAVLRVPAGRLLFSTDMSVENRDFRRDWSSAEDLGHKVAAANLSDINAMGGTATALVVAFAGPPDLPARWAAELTAGITAECALVGAMLVGGDVSAADEIVVSIAVLGTGADQPVLRSGARPGDVVAVCGRLGWAEAGLRVLRRGFRSPRAVVEAHRRPEPPYQAGPQAARLGATAMIDVSDGLLADLGHLAAASGVGIDVRSDALAPAEPLHAVGAALGVDPMRFVLTGGEDFALAATFPADVPLPEAWTVVGVTGEAAEGAAAVTVDGADYEGSAGHEQFS